MDVKDTESAGLLDLSPLPKAERRAIDAAEVDRRLRPPRRTWWTWLRDVGARVREWFT
jgi:hypothetical protein